MTQTFPNGGKRRPHKTTYLVATPIPDTALLLENKGNRCIGVHFTFSLASASPEEHAPTYVSDLIQQLNAYFFEKKHSFTQPVLEGTSFQNKVWAALCRIPPGQTRTYSMLARQLNTSARAIGNACRKNPFPVVVPCHRVVGKNTLGGFMGETTGRQIFIKKWLLQYEIKHFHD